MPDFFMEYEVNKRISKNERILSEFASTTVLSLKMTIEKFVGLANVKSIIEISQVCQAVDEDAIFFRSATWDCLEEGDWIVMFICTAILLQRF